MSTDEERLIEAVARAHWQGTLGTHRALAMEWAEGLVGKIRAEGVTLTPPPAPEPTYTITESQRRDVARALHTAKAHRMDMCPDDGRNVLAAWELMTGLQPDEVQR